ncbi:hypothetical protein ACOMHN_034679 [Nucella lapillus]
MWTIQRTAAIEVSLAQYVDNPKNGSNRGVFGTVVFTVGSSWDVVGDGSERSLCLSAVSTLGASSESRGR